MNSHLSLSRRFFLRCGAAIAGLGAVRSDAAEPLPAEVEEAVKRLESYLTSQKDFTDVSRGNPVPHSLSEERRKEVGLTRETWQLELLSDPEHPANIKKQFTKKGGNAITFEALLKLGVKHAVRFPKLMTCLNLGCPLGMGIWEGVPLRTLIWMAEPQENLRRVFYYGFHNDDPKQMFRSSLPVGRILEDFDDLPPVIVCYKLNGDWLSPERGGPVRIVVPEHYGYKSVKWLSHIFLSNLWYANDTYGTQNNDVDSPLKTFAATISVPITNKVNQPIPITGYAQSGISGLSKVQVWVQPGGQKWPEDDPYFTRAPWTDATILPPPKSWGGGLDKIPPGTIGFDDAGKPKAWPMRLAKAHWAALIPGLPAGEYTFRCRTIDSRGQAQPMPRPFKKSGRCDIEAIKITVA